MGVVLMSKRELNRIDVLARLDGRRLADRKNMGIYQQFCRFYLPNGIHFAQDVEHSHRADLVLQQHPLLLHGR
jgi:hypothetical protein